MSMCSTRNKAMELFQAFMRGSEQELAELEHLQQINATKLSARLAGLEDLSQRTLNFPQEAFDRINGLIDYAIVACQKTHALLDDQCEWKKEICRKRFQCVHDCWCPEGENCQNHTRMTIEELNSIKDPFPDVVEALSELDVVVKIPYDAVIEETEALSARNEAKIDALQAYGQALEDMLDHVAYIAATGTAEKKQGPMSCHYDIN
jgi:sulfopyruvate decarboxylase TPP-binding subunit